MWSSYRRRDEEAIGPPHHCRFMSFILQSPAAEFPDPSPDLPTTRPISPMKSLHQTQTFLVSSVFWSPLPPPSIFPLSPRQLQMSNRKSLHLVRAATMIDGGHNVDCSRKMGWCPCSL
ncbi:unnamed protein product [Linum tenue]|uniref:Uncharacterized protein n=1 Tax=Linum tenue TaxID=586396 RepID=A0AAV0R5M0_9ROSI|nr:unnamed protein product [Linum tenue]